jgi:hypothetical protein
MLKSSLKHLAIRPSWLHHLVRSRSGTVIAWVLPAAAVLALASYLWFAPGPRRPISAGEMPDSEADNSNTLATDSTVPRTEQHDGARLQSLKPVIDKTTQTPIGSAKRSVEQQLEGEWEGYYQGQRRLTVRSDGTCTMTAEPEGLAATLLAAKLTFEIQWKMNGEHMEFETTGGEPLDKVKIVLRMYGSKRSHRIVNLAPNELVLLDEDGVTKYEWHRVTSEIE